MSQLVLGCQIQRRCSSGRQCWRNVAKEDLPWQILEEIEGEIGGGSLRCNDFIASNGRHYRWEISLQD